MGGAGSFMSSYFTAGFEGFTSYIEDFIKLLSVDVGIINFVANNVETRFIASFVIAFTEIKKSF